MTAAQILAAYPTFPVAVAYVELILCGSVPGEESAWELMTRAVPPLTPDEILECIREAMTGETECRAQEALAQTAAPAFRDYLAAKLGMM